MSLRGGMEASPPPVTTRSELFARRRYESATAFQEQYDRWETSNPAWARRLTGPAAAAALGFGGGCDRPFPTRRDMILERRKTARQAAVQASGFDEAMQATLRHLPPEIHTSIARPTADPSMVWVDAPAHGTRSSLRAERRYDNVRTLEAATEKNLREGKLDAEQRVQQRIDQNVAFLQAAPVGKSRQELLASRRKQRADGALAASPALEKPRPPSFAAQSEPFWTLNKRVEQPADYTTSQERASQSSLKAGAAHAAEQCKKLESHTATLPPEVADSYAPKLAAAAQRAENAAAAAAHTAAAPSAAAVLPNGSQSVEVLRARQRWWAKPEVYPAVGLAEPRQEEPFKLAKGDSHFLARKLSSGPKRAQRGYPAESRSIADKVTSLPPPSLAHYTDKDRKPFQAYTGATFKFLPSEPRETLAGVDDPTSFDGYEFTQPLYSSFTADKTFQPPRLPPRPRPRQGPAPVRERARPPTNSGERVDFAARAGAMPSTAPNGPGMGGLTAADTMRPGTTALGGLRG